MNDLEKSIILQEKINKIGALISDEKKKEAIAIGQEAYDFARQAFGPNHINTAVTLSTLGGCFSKDDQHKKGSEMLEEAIAILINQPENCDLQIAQVKNNLSVTYRHLFMPQKALTCAVEAVKTRADLQGYNHIETSTSIANIGFIFSWMGMIDLALACYQLAYSSNPSNTGSAVNFKKLSEVVAEDYRFTYVPTLPRKDFQLTFYALTALCDFILSRPLPEDFFLITHGQPAHKESYLHYIYQLKKAVIDIFGGQNKPDDHFVSIIQLAKQKLLSNTSLPLHSGKLFLKRIEKSNLRALGLATLTYAFPGFSTAMLKRKEEMGIKSKHKSFNDIKQENLKGEMTFSYTDKQYRRYSGDNNLPTSCYYSLSDSSGDDKQTLCKELFEYTDLDIPGLVWISDSWDAEFMNAVSLQFPKTTLLVPGIYVLMLAPEEEEEKSAYLKFYAPIFKELGSSGGLSIIHIPLDVTTKAVERIVDLRRLETQSWFRTFFGMGDGAIFVKSVTSLPVNFTDMLPALTYPEYGGSGVTKSVGSWFRLSGVSGLIYPSARADAFVEYDTNNSLSNSSGWNFIDYSTSNFIPDRDTHIDLHDWYDFVGGRQESAKLKVNGSSWKIEGAEERYKQFRRFFIDLMTQLAASSK